MTINKIPHQMTGVILTGHGGLEKLQLRTDLPVPTPGKGEVLIKVGASGVNNTDINTRIGWYSKGVTGQTNAGAADGFETANDDDASWSGIPLGLPRIQGADCCGEIVAVGEQVNPDRIGQRVLVRSMQSVPTEDEFSCITFGSECDGSFAQYTKTRAIEAFTIQSSLSDAELASFPCAYSTAENMIDRAAVKANETVLITGASGGVGSAAIQLAKRRQANVIAICGAEKMEQVKALGADKVIQRGQSLTDILANDSVDVVIDLVAGDQWAELLDLLRRGGRYAVAGAIAGPIVELDVRTLYLKDLSFFGCTYQPRSVFENLIQYIERGEIKPLIAKTYPLQQISEAQQDFMAKKFIGKLVLLPPR
ncbi:alcohol dehydrogenase family protein [Neptunomonas qingdaonensis]|uniref:NADPH:quinone reductase n=1 Tax=Neptunomonas qingdaonensis TaxID=1045558 RepID=A0A1I2RP13_9GAMM|nr:alcohol dehydrogenase family protein [Neptunomonas qingdaonensis]SFG39506.1 NADPH:quinone reductase [Neptunomonas qingdaonensis]